MKNKLIVAVLLLGALALVTVGLAAELHLLSDACADLAPYAFVAGGVLLLILAWRSWPNLMAWAFKQEDRESMK